MSGKSHNSNSLLIELHYFPSLEYFVALKDHDEIIFEQYENFVKQTYRNRFYIRTANKVTCLSIPLKKGSRTIKDIKIDYQQGWLKDHWRTIVSAYGKSPFFEYYRDDFEAILFKKEPFLFELNFKILTKCLEYLDLRPKLNFTTQYDKLAPNGVLDKRGIILPKKSFNERGIYRSRPYQQIFGKDFESNLSLLDLLCCEGPQSGLILNESKCHNDEQIEN